MSDLSPDDWADILIPVIQLALKPIKQQVAHLTQVAERLAPAEKRIGELEAALRELETKV